jgi:transcriptional regulator of acetoin/glycerol metabolism
VRELRAEVRRATAAALAQGSPRLTAADLVPEAGTRFEAPPSESASFPADEVAEALAAERGNVLGAARRLNVHRNQIRRWLERYGVDARRFKQ